MKVTKSERKESTKHCCGNGYLRKNTAEQEGNEEALIEKRITENNLNNTSGEIRLLEEIVSAENMNRAYQEVKRNKGAGEIDGMEVKELYDYLKETGDELRKAILAGKYKSNPVRRVEIPKGNGKKKKLGIPTVVDRVIQQAISQVIAPYTKENSWKPVMDSDQGKVRMTH